MDRRRFLQHGGVLAAAGLASTACATEEPFDARLLAQPALLGVLGAAAVQEIGLRYLERLPPAERSAAAVRAALANAAREARPWPWSPPPTLAALITDDFAADPAEERVVLPGGWVLSVTEARQCALLALAAR